MVIICSDHTIQTSTGVVYRGLKHTKEGFTNYLVIWHIKFPMKSRISKLEFALVGLHATCISIRVIVYNNPNSFQPLKFIKSRLKKLP